MNHSIEEFRAALLSWFDVHRRVMPWRALPGQTPNPYHVLLSEAMLQQTQVATVIPYFERFVAALPTIESLARADEEAVMKLWAGLGYYRRARNLMAAAKAIVSGHAGLVPNDVATLLTLPGVGRYTAGAIASIAFGTLAPIVDGNVVRVICRLDAIEDDPAKPAVLKRIWSRAESLVHTGRAGDFNQALMELGATVCTPKSPRCLTCPVRQHCEAFDKQIVNRVPPVKVRAETKLHERAVVIAKDSHGRYAVRKRPADGRWAGLWEFATFDAAADWRKLAAAAGLELSAVEQLGVVAHALTHRRYRFDVFAARDDGSGSTWTWLDAASLENVPMGKPQRAAAKLAGLTVG